MSESTTNPVPGDGGEATANNRTENPEGTTRNGGVFVLSDVGSEGFRSQSTESLAAKLIFLPADKSNWLENVSVDLFEQPLRRGANLKTFTPSMFFGRETKMGDVEQRSSRTQLGFLGHLIERGLGGGQVYMAAGGNHRAISLKHWVSQESTKPCNLIESCVDPPDDSCKFDVGSKIAVYLHGLTTDTESSCVVMKSPCVVDGVDPSDNVNSYNLFSVASKRRMTILNGKLFKRLLLFFGYTSDIADDAMVGFEHIIGFFDLFRSYEFGTMSGFQKFYDEFEMQHVFTYDRDNMCIEEVHRKFGELLRSLVPVRLLVYDGQHRFLLMTFFMTGYLDVDQKLVLKVSNWTDSSYHQRSQAYERIQSFQQMSYVVGIAMENDGSVMLNPVRIMEAMHIAGVLITESQDLSIPAEWEEFFAKLETYIANMKVLGFEEFYGQNAKDSNVFGENGKLLVEGVAKVLTASSRFKKFFVSDDNETFVKKWPIVTNVLLERCASTADMGGDTKLKIEMRQLLQLFRSIMENPNQRSSFRQLLEINQSKFPQRCSQLKYYTKRFAKAEWLRKFLYEVVYELVNHFEVRYYVERHIITMLHRAGDPRLKYGLEDDCKWDVADFEKWPSDTVLKKAGKASALKAALTIDNKDSFLRGQIIQGLWSGFTNDIIDTIITYGHDPDFFSRPSNPKNSSAETDDEVKAFMDDFEATCKEVKSELLESDEFQEAKTTSKKVSGRKEYLFEKSPVLLMKDPDLSDDEDGCDSEEDGEDGEPKGKWVKYNTFYDVQTRMVEAAMQKDNPLLTLKFFHNNLLREYLDPSNAEGFSQFDPNPRTSKAPGIKFTMELLLKLFYEYITEKFPLTYCGLSLLKGLEGKHETLFKAAKNRYSVVDGIKFGTSNQSGCLPVAVKSEYSSPGSILKKPMLFSTFVQAVLSDAVNVDEFKCFQDHCRSSSVYLQKLNNMKAKCVVKAGYNADKNEPTKNSQVAQQVNFAKQKIVSMVKGENKDTEMQIRAFRFLQESGLIKNVTVLDAGLKAELAEAMNNLDDKGNFKKPEPENGSVSGVSLVDLLPGFGDMFKAHKEQRKKEKEDNKKRKKNAGEFPSLPAAVTNSASFDEPVVVNQTPVKRNTYCARTSSPLKRKTPTEAGNDAIAIAREEQAASDKKRKQREELEKAQKAETAAKKAKAMGIDKLPAAGEVEYQDAVLDALTSKGTGGGMTYNEIKQWLKDERLLEPSKQELRKVLMEVAMSEKIGKKKVTYRLRNPEE